MKTPRLLAMLLLIPALPLTATDAVPECFPGAIYRKVVTPQGPWLGIEGEVVLPVFTPDPARTNPRTGRPLDNTSIYMGGHSNGQEIDAGLTWEVVRVADGTVSKLPMAFRPFWRNDAWYNAPAKPEYYFFPGDRIFMSCVLVQDNEMEMNVVVRERGADSAAALAALGFTADDAPTTLTVRFEAPDFLMSAPCDFKRVNAIDQSGNEGLAAQPTAAASKGAVWTNVILHARDSSRVPFAPTDFLDMRCPNLDQIVVRKPEGTDSSAEAIDIIGGHPSAPPEVQAVGQ